MSTNIRSEISSASPYWLEKHRYHELKHFCLQYPIWKRAYDSLTGLSARPRDLALFPKVKEHSDPTSRCAEARLYYRERMELVEETAKRTSENLWKYLLVGVTEEISYGILKARYDIPCCKNTYYELYRKFFWILNQERG